MPVSPREPEMVWCALTVGTGKASPIRSFASPIRSFGLHPVPLATHTFAPPEAEPTKGENNMMLGFERRPLTSPRKRPFGTRLASPATLTVTPRPFVSAISSRGAPCSPSPSHRGVNLPELRTPTRRGLGDCGLFSPRAAGCSPRANARLPVEAGAFRVHTAERGGPQLTAFGHYAGAWTSIEPLALPIQD